MDTIKIMQDLNDVKRIVITYKNGLGEVFLGHSFFYGGREGSKFLIFLYEEKLPKKMKLLDAWNYLDNNSYKIRTVPVESHAVAIDDFLMIYKPNLTWKDLTYYKVKDFSELENEFSVLETDNDTVSAFIIE